MNNTNYIVAVISPSKNTLNYNRELLTLKKISKLWFSERILNSYFNDYYEYCNEFENTNKNKTLSKYYPHRMKIYNEEVKMGLKRMINDINRDIDTKKEKQYDEPQIIQDKFLSYDKKEYEYCRFNSKDCDKRCRHCRLKKKKKDNEWNF